ESNHDHTPVKVSYTVMSDFQSPSKSPPRTSSGGLRGGSSSTIVTVVALGGATVAPAALERPTLNVSLGSSIASLRIGIVNDCVLPLAAPVANVILPVVCV